MRMNQKLCTVSDLGYQTASQFVFENRFHLLDVYKSKFLVWKGADIYKKQTSYYWLFAG